MSLNLQPMTFSEACVFVKANHRHHSPPQGHLFSIGINNGTDVVGVVIVGRPVSRMLDDGYTAEVTRCCVKDAQNGCSMLYRAAWRAAKAMGYRRLVTYTLPEEGGGSLRATGFTLVGEAGGGSWSRDGRPRVDKAPKQRKLRWELSEVSK